MTRPNALLLIIALSAGCKSEGGGDAGSIGKPGTSPLRHQPDAPPSLDAGAVAAPGEHVEVPDSEELKAAFSVAYFAICGDRDAGLPLMIDVYNRAGDGGVVRRLAGETLREEGVEVK